MHIVSRFDASSIDISPTASESLPCLRLPPPGNPVAKMTTPTETFLDTLDEVESQLRLTATWVAEMSMQDSEMQAHVRRWTLFAPPDRYEKRVGKADAFFGPMDWHDITAFAQRSKQEWVYDPWNFFFMLEHLSDRFPVQLKTCERVNHQLLLAGESGIPDKRCRIMTNSKPPN